MRNKIGERIHNLRKEADMTLNQLASELNVSLQAINKWEKGRSCPDIQSLPALSKIFGVSIDYLITGKEWTAPQLAPSHWSVLFVNELIKPKVLSEYGAQNLIKTVNGYDLKYAKECIILAFNSYVNSEEPNRRAQQINTMLTKLGGVLYNHSLSPVDQTINRMVSSLAKRCSDVTPSAISILKRKTKELLSSALLETATDDERLKYLNRLNETDFAQAKSLKQCNLFVRLKIFTEQQNKVSEEQLRKYKERVREGLFCTTIGWPETVNRELEIGNQMAREENYQLLMLAMYAATEETTKLMIEALPESKRPRLETNMRLHQYARDIYSWFGKDLGKADANYIVKISSCIKERLDISMIKTDLDLYRFDTFMKRLFRKYTKLVNRPQN